MRGSKELKKELPYGVLKKITKAFELDHQGYVSEVISGKKNSKRNIVDCACEIRDAYKSSGVEDKIDEILKRYKSMNRS